MRSVPPAALVVAFIFSLLLMMSAILHMPLGMRIVLGVVAVFFLPGFSVLSVCDSGKSLPWPEFLFASLGTSMAVSTCAAVLLGATPIGLSSSTLAVVLGGISLVLCLCSVAKRLPAT